MTNGIRNNVWEKDTIGQIIVMKTHAHFSKNENHKSKFNTQHDLSHNKILQVAISYLRLSMPKQA
jgi:hypothetical protein